MKVQYHDLSGKTVVITGGANGIGAAMVRKFQLQESVVHFCDIDVAKGEALAGQFANVHFSKVDLRKPEEIQDWISGIELIDVLINNAANDPRIPLRDLTVDQWDELIALNLRSQMLTIREAVDRFRKPASIINFSSITFHLGPVEMAAYVATKGGILAMSRSLARELGKEGIRVNTISPGWIMTERQLEQFVDDDTKALIRERQCIPDLLQPDEIADVALFLASSSSGALTGQELLADRGWYFS
ncbi:MAG: SDR family NAD(P)-dependent oxidoreductase [Verrucomicrobiales bacterium]|nr:SDR family NAD(P)-dependent oxidoreductase [Verrucomicrobiales bacterium]